MSESTDQIALFDFFARVDERLPLLSYAFHVPNGEKRDKATAARLQRMGVRPGVWDIWLPIHNRVGIAEYRPGYFSGLVIEMKSGKGSLSPAQLDWRGMLTLEGWYCLVCYEWTDAARLCVRWVGGTTEEFGL